MIKQTIMDWEILPKIQDIIENGEKFLLVRKDSLDEDDQVFASLALGEFLKSRGKQVFYWPSFENEKMPNAFKKLTEENNGYYRAEIKIPKNLGLANVSYEEREDNFVILIESKEKPRDENKIKIEKAKIKPDGVFSFAKYSDEAIKNEFCLPESEKIVLFENSGSLAALKIKKLIESIDPDWVSLPKITSLLLASIYKETKNFQEKITGEALKLAGELLEKKPEQEMIAQFSQKPEPNHSQLLGRALARTYFDENLYSNWTFLKMQDFQKTKTCPGQKLIYTLYQNIRSLTKDAKFHFIFWEETQDKKSKIAGLVAGQNEASLGFLAQSSGGQIQSNYFFTPPFSSFSEAELTFRKLLKTLIKDKL